MPAIYFKDRAEAGKLLADQLEPKYRWENCVVIALDDGGVVVGSHIAARLHCVLTLLLTDSINLPRETDAVGVIDQDGDFTYNQMYSSGELDELESEFRNVIEQEKLEKFHHLHELVGGSGLIKRELLRGQNIILVADGLNSTFALDAAASFLKPVKIEHLIVATPLANVQAVDRMHILADELYCLSVPADYMNTDHYYEHNDVPDHAAIIKTIQQIVLHWK